MTPSRSRRRPPWPAVATRALTWGLTLSAAFGCGAEVDQPAPVYADPGQQCPSLADQMPTLVSELEADALPGLSTVLSERITDDQLSAALDGTLRLLRRLTADELGALAGLVNHPTLSGATHQLEVVLDLLERGPDGVRTEVFEELQFLMATCEGGRMMQAMNALADAPELSQALTALGQTLSLPEVKALLAGGGPDPSALSRAGFNALVGNMMLKIAEPGFSFDAHIRAPLEELGLLPLDEPPMRDLMDALSGIMSPQRGVQRAMSDMMCCSFYGTPACTAGASLRDSGPILRDLLYDLILSQSLGGESSPTDLFQSLEALTSDPVISEALKPLGTVLQQMSEDADLRRALADLGVALMDPASVALMLPDLRHLIESGAADELFGVFALVSGECSP